MRFPYSGEQYQGCSDCEAAGIWGDFWKSERAACEELCCLYPEAMDHLLSCDPQERDLGDPDLHPLLVGFNDFGEKQVLAAGQYCSVLTLDRLGVVLQTDDPQERRLFPGMRVPILRWDPHESTEAAILAAGGVDATGPFYWKFHSNVKPVPNILPESGEYRRYYDRLMAA